MTQRESALSRKIITALRAEGWFAFKVHGSALMMSGLPDIICCADGYFIGIETKMPQYRTNTSPAQDLRRDQIADAAGYYVVVCSPAEAVEMVQNYLRGRRRTRA